MTTEKKRDLAADLAICEAVRYVYYDEGGGYQADYPDLGQSRHYFDEAFEGWPEAIRRAIAAESRVQEASEAMTWCADELAKAQREAFDLRKEVERLRKDKQRLHSVYDAQYARSTEYWGEIERLRRENQRLRSVLERMDTRKHAMMPRSQMARLAKEALDYTEGADADDTQENNGR
jgi:chromosome segregation ATPase